MDSTSELYPTNSFISTSFDVLKVDGVEDPSINVNSLSSFEFEESYFSNAVSFITECSTEHSLAKQKLYTSIAEAKTIGTVLEGYSDYFSKVKIIIDKFLKFLKALCDRAVSTISNLIRSDKNLLVNKKEFEKFKGQIEISGYEYTFTDSVPNANAAYEYMYSIFDDVMFSMKNGNITDVSTTLQGNSLEKDFAKFRGTVLSMPNKSIAVSDFASELFKVYRNNKSDTSTIIADPSYIKMVSERYFDISAMKRSINAQYRSVKDAYNKLEKELEAIIGTNSELNVSRLLDSIPSNRYRNADINTELLGTSISADVMSKLDIYTKMKVMQIEGYSNIHTLAYSAKLDALKECTIQDRNTLYQALLTMKVTKESCFFGGY